MPSGRREAATTRSPSAVREMPEVVCSGKSMPIGRRDMGLGGGAAMEVRREEAFEGAVLSGKCRGGWTGQ